MATHQTKCCPECGEVYERNSYAGRPSKANRTEYGSPLKKCSKCGTYFKDDEYREIAVDGIRSVDTMLVSPSSIFVGIVGIVLCLGALLSGAYVPAIAFLVLFGISPAMEALSYKKRQAELEQKKAESEARLQDPGYALILKKMGYNVPDKYLPRI